MIYIFFVAVFIYDDFIQQCCRRIGRSSRRIFVDTRHIISSSSYHIQTVLRISDRRRNDIDDDAKPILAWYI